MTRRHASGYQFIEINNLPSLRSHLYDFCDQREVKGTILLSEEGINVNLCAESTQLDEVLSALKKLKFDIHFKITETPIAAYKRLKVKIKKEIITFRAPSIQPQKKSAANLDPETLKSWLDNNQDFILLDTRNGFEIEHGTFKKAKHFNLHHFTDLKAACPTLPKNKTIVMFCTGGIRCEKAALYFEEQGFQNVYQLEGGILNYFKRVGGAHYDGACYVFDDRLKVNAKLEMVP